nr:hypothetical protein [uncultured Flavobacterium sp.]
MNNNFNTILSTLMTESINLLKNNSSQRRKRINRLSALKESYVKFDKFDKFETDFEKDFIEVELKETCFFIISGIETNYTSIPMYLELKKKLGLNFSWVHIKRAQQHFDLKGDIIKINLNKFEKHYSNFTLISFPIILLMQSFNVPI